MSSNIFQHNHIQPKHPNTRLQEGQYETSVPTMMDRIVRASLKLVLEPIFEADFQPCSYGFGPRRRSQDTIAEIHYDTNS
jgi:RNA-directed DNA polymerase